MKGYVTQEEFKNLAKGDTSDFALKTNVAEIKSRVDDIDVNKINIIGEIQEKNYVENSYLYFNQEYEYFEVDETNPHKLLSLRSAGISNEKLEPSEDKNAPKILYDKIWASVKIESSKFLAQKKISQPPNNIINIYMLFTFTCQILPMQKAVIL